MDLKKSERTDEENPRIEDESFNPTRDFLRQQSISRFEIMRDL